MQTKEHLFQQIKDGLRHSGILAKYSLSPEDAESLAGSLAERLRPSAGSNWIPIAQCLPEYGQSVLLLHQEGQLRFYRIGLLENTDQNGNWWLFDGSAKAIRSAITHWMPLPEMPPD